MENASDFGDARIAGTPDGLIITRPGFRVIQRTRVGGTDTVATNVTTGLVAWDPSTDGVAFTDGDRLRRATDGGIETLATQPVGYFALAVGLDGTVYFSHWVDATDTEQGHQVSAIERDGDRRVINDIGSIALAVAPDGGLISSEGGRVVRIDPVTGAREIIAGSGDFCDQVSRDPCGDDGPAVDAAFSEITSIDVGDDGSIYLAEHRNARVRVIRPDGTLHHLAGSYVPCQNVEGGVCPVGFGATTFLYPIVSIAVTNAQLFVVDQWEKTRLLQVLDADRAPAVPHQGYRMIASDGGVFTFGWSPFHGSTGDLQLVSPIVAGRSNGAGGYWFVAGDGGVFTFGDVSFYGSPVGRTDSPVVDMAVVPNGRGYWIAERDGTVHAYGEAGITVSFDPPPYAAIVNRPGQARLVAERPQSLPTLNRPIVAAHNTRSGNGLWYVASDGGVFTEGDAGFFGSTGAMRLNQPVLDLIPTPTEQGYWLIAADGGVFTFGDAAFHGSMGAVRLNQPVVAGVAGPSRSGYAGPMGKIVKGIVLGAVVGGGIRAAQDLRNTEDDLGAIAPRVAKTAGEAALAGAAVGVLLTARDRRRMRRMRRSAKGVAKLRNLAETGIQVAVPALHHAAETARPHVLHAMEEARERAHELSDAARPRIEQASKRARKRYEKELKKARPKVERAAKDARQRAATVADLASERAKRTLADLDLPTTIVAV